MCFQELVCVVIAVDDEIGMRWNLRHLIYPSRTSSL